MKKLVPAALLLLILSLALPLSAFAQGDRDPISAENAAQVVEVARFGRGTVNVAAYSADGESIYFGGALGVWMYAADFSGAPVLMAGHTQPVTALAVDPAGVLVASGSEDESIAVWSASSGELVATLDRHDNEITSLSFSPGGTLLASGSRDKTVRVWDLTTNLKIQTLEHESAVNTVAFSADGRLLASADSDGIIIVWDAATGETIAELDNGRGINALAISPDGAYIAAGGSSSTLYLWDIEAEEWVWAMTESIGTVRSVAFSPDGEVLVFGTSSKMIALDAESGSELADWSDIHDDDVNSIAFAPEGTVMISVDASSTIKQWSTLAPGSEGTAPLLWEVSSPFVLDIAPEHANGMESIAFNLDGTRLIAATQADSARLWELASGEELAVLRADFPSWGAQNAVAFSPVDADLLAVLDTDAGLRLLDASGAEVALLAEYEEEMTTFAFSPDGAIIATAEENGVIVLWDVATNRRAAVLQNHVGEVNSLVFSADGALLASASDDGTVRLWGVGE